MTAQMMGAMGDFNSFLAASSHTPIVSIISAFRAGIIGPHITFYKCVKDMPTATQLDSFSVIKGESYEQINP